MFKRMNPNDRMFEPIDSAKHPDYQSVNTRVSEYLRKYGQGKIDSMPTDTRPEIQDTRTVDEMLADPHSELGLGTEEADALIEFQSYEQRFKDAQAAVDANAKDMEKFQSAMDVLNNPNSSDDARRDAYRILDELERKGKIVR